MHRYTWSRDSFGQLSLLDFLHSLNWLIPFSVGRSCQKSEDQSPAHYLVDVEEYQFFKAVVASSASRVCGRKWIRMANNCKKRNVVEPREKCYSWKKVVNKAGCRTKANLQCIRIMLRSVSSQSLWYKRSKVQSWRISEIPLLNGFQLLASQQNVQANHPASSRKKISYCLIYQRTTRCLIQQCEGHTLQERVFQMSSTHSHQHHRKKSLEKRGREIKWTKARGYPLRFSSWPLAVQI